MKYVVGLGNPGKKYQGTRHNVGQVVVDRLRKENLVGVKLVKPDTFMNESGKAVQQLRVVNFEQLYVVHDDLDIPLGKFKIMKGKGPRDHKGLKSIYESVGKDFWHVRVGVENRKGSGVLGEEYVLQRFLDEEKIIVDEVTEEVVRVLKEKINEN